MHGFSIDDKPLAQANTPEQLWAFEIANPQVALQPETTLTRHPPGAITQGPGGCPSPSCSSPRVPSSQPQLQPVSQLPVYLPTGRDIKASEYRDSDVAAQPPSPSKRIPASSNAKQTASSNLGTKREVNSGTRADSGLSSGLAGAVVLSGGGGGAGDNSYDRSESGRCSSPPHPRTPINESPRAGVSEQRKDPKVQDSSPLEQKREPPRLQDERAVSPSGPTYVGSGRDPDYEIPTGAQTETEVWKSLAKDEERKDHSLKQDRYGFLIAVQEGRDDADRSRRRRESGGAASSSTASADLTMQFACMPRLLQQRQQRGRLAQQYDGRERKWCKMLGFGGSGLDDYRRRRPEKLKRRVRKGISDSLRIWAWLSLSGGLQLKKSNPGLFAALLSLHGEAAPGRHGAESIAEGRVIPSAPGTDRDSRAESGVAAQQYHAPSAEVVMCIMRDLNRTFPNHLAFMRRQSVGQKALFSVLWASAAYRPLVGYVQGMGFLAAVLLLYMPDEDAFWTFQAMMQGPPGWPERWAMERLYTAGMPGLQCCMYQVDGWVG
ncbi:hypothetical protein Vafri_3433 [Volvox africanus]|uniref:Rab-GAP TBC domain-containing protein n=1 Tax=Volvox africanus TaxID=51714 RepID=A0A8J4EWB8_9CHLO|nr:hypothetical protein Vafri_3433 [Volvox africanus]